LNLGIEEKLPALRGNPIRLRQLVDNLLVNAVKYTPDGGTLTVNLFRQGEQVILEVIDTGLGIPPTDQPHIFEKFYRASNTPKNTPGTGLGLAIVKSIVENHDGRIWLESFVGKGSKFVVVLPVYKRDDD
jgi:signal transduction histidine kinase